MTGIWAAILGGSATILLVLALRLLKKHLPRALFPALWCAAAARLLLPVSIPTRFSIWNLLRSPPAAAAGGAVSDRAFAFPTLAGRYALGILAPSDAQVSPGLLIWLTGAALLAAYFAVGYACMVRRFHGTRLAPQPSTDALLDRFRFSRDPRIFVSNSRRAPLTFGVFHPTVLLPEDLPVGSAEFQLVLAHELAHIRRKECLRKLAFTVCLCVYWWNPLVWLMVHLANRDIELACDEAVLRALGPECKKAYALALLDMAQRRSCPAPLCSAFAKSSAEARIRAIVRFKRAPAWTAVCASILFALSSVVLATQAAPAQGGTEAERAAKPLELSEPIQIPEPASPAPANADPVQPELPSPEPEALPDAAPKYIFPLENPDAAVTDSFGWRVHPVSGTSAFHSGVDLEASAGSNVLAVAGGTVLKAEYNEAYGYFVLLEHEDGVQTFYAHLQELLTAPGDEVQQGQIIGLVGSSGWSTGPHLHLGVTQDGESVDPLAALQGS